MDSFVGREKDLHNITHYLDFTKSHVQVVHIVGPPGFGKSTLAKKFGEMLLRQWVKVHYIDARMVRDIDTLSEKIMLSVADSIEHRVTFSRLEKWVREQYSNTLIIIDNCDELFEYVKGGCLGAIKPLTLASSRKNVRYILTSQKWVTEVGNFRIHAIDTLTSKEAIELLNRVAPGLTDDQKIQIAALTGNVPLWVPYSCSLMLLLLKRLYKA